MDRHPTSSQKSTNDSDARSFVLLQTEQLSNLNVIGHDKIADALNALVDSSPVDFTIDNAIALCEQAMSLLRPPEIKVKSTCEASRPKSEREADAYDEYFPVVRVDGPPRHVFAWSLLSAFRDLLIEAKAGTSLTPVEWSVIRQGFVELALLITGYEDCYYEE